MSNHGIAGVIACLNPDVFKQNLDDYSKGSRTSRARCSPGTVLCALSRLLTAISL